MVQLDSLDASDGLFDAFFRLVEIIQTCLRFSTGCDCYTLLGLFFFSVAVFVLGHVGCDHMISTTKDIINESLDTRSELFRLESISQLLSPETAMELLAKGLPFVCCSMII